MDNKIFTIYNLQLWADLKGKTFSHAMYVACKQCIQGYDSDQLGPFQTYPHIFERGDYFLFPQTIRVRM